MQSRAEKFALVGRRGPRPTSCNLREMRPDRLRKSDSTALARHHAAVAPALGDEQFRLPRCALPAAFLRTEDARQVLDRVLELVVDQDVVEESVVLDLL